MMILTVKAVVRNGRKYLAGTAIEVDEETAKNLVRKGFAVLMDAPRETREETAEPVKPAEPEEEREGLAPEEIDTEAKMPEADEVSCTVIRKTKRRAKA